MSVKARIAVLALAVVFSAGCETIPEHEVPDLYPASGPLGVRTGLSFQRNFSTDHTMPYWDASDFYKEGYGFAVEIPVDVNPWWGGFAGIGYEYFDGKSGTYEFPDGAKYNVEMDPIGLLPFYIGLTGRYPGWLDDESWADDFDHVWIPNDPVGFAPYVRGSVGGAVLLGSADITNKDTGMVDKAFDTQVMPFFEGAAGLEYRSKSIGYWAEMGYRLYIIPDRENAGFGSDRMARMNGMRIMVGMTWYLW